MKNLNIYKQLYKINRLSINRDPNYGTNKMVKTIGKIFSIVWLLAIIVISVIVYNKEFETYEDLSPILTTTNYAIVAVLLYEMFLRATISLNKPPLSPFAFFILPIERKKIILFRQIYTAFDKLSLMFLLITVPLIVMIANTYQGGRGVIRSIILLFLLFVLNKQIFDFLYNNLKRRKVASIVLLLAYITLLGLPILFSTLELNENLLVYGLSPNLALFFVNLIALSAAIWLIITVNNKYLRSLSMDDMEESSGKVSNLKFINKLTNNMGLLGEYLKNDIKMLLRIKQIRMTITMMPIILLFIIIISSKEKDIAIILTKNITFIAFLAMMSILTISQYEAFHWGFYFSRKSNIKLLLWSKWILNTCALTLLFLPLLIYSALSGGGLLPIVSLYFTAISIGSISSIFFATLNTTSINPHKKSRNTQNFNGIIFLIMVLNPLIFWAVYSIYGENKHLYIILINIVVLACYPFIIKAASNLLIKRKHKSLEIIMNN